MNKIIMINRASSRGYLANRSLANMSGKTKTKDKKTAEQLLLPNWYISAGESF